MARSKSGILGAFSGKVGPIVGVISGDSYYIRSSPEKRSKTSDAELMSRARFGLVQKTLSPIKDFVQVGFKKYWTKTGGLRGALSYNLKFAVRKQDQDFEIDPALFKVSGGTLQNPPDLKMTFESTGQIRFRWTYHSLDLLNGYDQLMMLAIDLEHQKAVYQKYAALRKDGTDVLEIPNGFIKNDLHIYAGFVAADRSRQSDSIYLGMKARPSL